MTWRMKMGLRVIRRNKEHVYTLEYLCSVCGVVLFPEMSFSYGDVSHVDIDELRMCSCGADLRDELIFEEHPKEDNNE